MYWLARPLRRVCAGCGSQVTSHTLVGSSEGEGEIPLGGGPSPTKRSREGGVTCPGAGHPRHSLIPSKYVMFPEIPLAACQCQELWMFPLSHGRWFVIHII